MKYAWTTKKCITCKKEFDVPNSHASKRFSCSSKCYGISLRGKPTWNKGLKGFNMGEKSGKWKGGISKIDKSCRCLQEYKKWRSYCFERDKWTCQTCGVRGSYITVHHINGFSKIIRENNIKNIIEARECEELWDTNNGVTLCEDCHKLTDNYKGRAINNKHK